MRRLKQQKGLVRFFAYGSLAFFSTGRTTFTRKSVTRVALKITETKVKVESSVPLSIDDIMEEVIRSEEGRTMNSDRVRASLAQLGCDMPSITGVDETYSIDLKRILELAQIQEVESM
ncbi:hypothetical protein POM88_001535 [Heracleum sosnowskyi]|uniref:DNA-directed RNA polymerase III subunit RPC3 n=1 Tax=Heracleum sosnowskyi TaxID=360622 RepID=A0AAD8JCC6_9APIA|nr:hypothetical protein POM88_001535 [Heracleum sosnowskyi]